MDRCLLLLLPSLLLPLGCRDLDRFDTNGSSAYCGASSGTPFTEGLTPNGSQRLTMRLKLDTSQLTTYPGAITTGDASDGLCAPAPLFQDAPLRAIPALLHDALSNLEFGTGRDYNFFAWVDSTCQGTQLAVVSLMQNDDVELRLFKPAPGAVNEGGAAVAAGFGVFALDRSSDGCGF